MMMITVALIMLMAAASANAACSTLYPFGSIAGDDVTTTGDDNHAVSYSGTFNYYGSTYGSVYANINGPLSFGQYFTDYTESTSPDATPFLCAFWDDIRLTDQLGSIHHRKSTSIDDIALAEADLARLGDAKNVSSVIVVTWNGVQILGSSDTPQNIFQVVLVMALDGSMYSIFNYDVIDWGQDDGVVAFNKGDGQTIANLATSQDVGRAPYCTNVGVDGRVMVRVDQDTVQVDGICDFPSPLYPYGAAVGDDSATGTGADRDDGFVVSYSDPDPFESLQFYGSEYDSVFVNINGPLSFGQAYRTFSETTQPQNTPFLCAFWDDIDLTGHFGAIHYRQSDSIDDIELAEADLALLGDAKSVEWVIVVTWDGVQLHLSSVDSPQNYFQAVLVKAYDESYYAIFNYNKINWAVSEGVVAINKGRDDAIVNLLTSENMEYAHFYSNVGVLGRVVVRVDLDPVQEPTLTFDDGVPSVCTATTTGAVTDYTGLSAQLGSGDKFIITRSQGNMTDPCKFLVKAEVGNDGEIDWIAINVGVHSNPDKHRRSYAFNKKQGIVQERGEGVSAHDIALPYEWTHEGPHGDTSIKITGDSNCWTLESETCGYRFRFGPDGIEPVFRAIIVHDGDAIPTTDGPCGPITP